MHGRDYAIQCYHATQQWSNIRFKAQRFKARHLMGGTRWESRKILEGSVVFLRPVGLLNDTPEEVEFLTVKRFLTLEGLM